MLTEFQDKIFKLKYAKESETWEEMCVRVATHIASAEKEENFAEWTAKFYQLLSEGVFLPGGRVLANAGTGIDNLMNCFVLPVEDSRESIYTALSNAAEIFAWGGGLGFNFSKLRERGAPIKTTGGKSCGPLPFMGQFDTTGDVIHQASRRGAQMGVLNIDHPDIKEFIAYKSKPSPKFGQLLRSFKTEIGWDGADEEIVSLGYSGDPQQAKLREYIKVLEKVFSDSQLNHFNLSIGISNLFMEAVKNDGDWNLVSPLTGEVVYSLPAKELFKLISESSWKSGDPGVLFLDKVNEDNMIPEFGSIQATNPCGEVPLLENEACCLGSLNLMSFLDTSTNKFNFEFFEYAIRVGIRFLDNVQEVSKTTVDEINKTSKAFRRLGLGVMGFADLLAELEIPYDSEGAVEFAEQLSWFLSFFSWSESMLLAEERGVFDGWNGELNQDVVYKVLESKFMQAQEKENRIDFRSEKLRVRNVSVTSIAPTGSISLLAGVTSAIEPFFSLYYTRNITSGIENKANDSVTEFNSILIKKLKKYGFDELQINQIINEVKETGSIQHIEYIPQKLRDIFKTAHELSWKAHIDIQAAWQRYITNAVSKTINMSNDSTSRDLEEAIMYMWESGLKGGTIYRDGSKTFQILNTGKDSRKNESRH